MHALVGFHLDEAHFLALEFPHAQTGSIGDDEIGTPIGPPDLALHLLDARHRLEDALHQHLPVAVRVGPTNGFEYVLEREPQLVEKHADVIGRGSFLLRGNRARPCEGVEQTLELVAGTNAAITPAEFQALSRERMNEPVVPIEGPNGRRIDAETVTQIADFGIPPISGSHRKK
ncbi:MAG: hypothetical protein KatS3mg117_2138 [Geminicoccaceae bacterium]|nr:MAG: hypothetical protein KatS3mg117_2138 [Geminicoccaceae bacterium]